MRSTPVFSGWEMQLVDPPSTIEFSRWVATREGMLHVLVYATPGWETDEGRCPECEVDKAVVIQTKTEHDGNDIDCRTVMTDGSVYDYLNKTDSYLTRIFEDLVLKGRITIDDKD